MSSSIREEINMCITNLNQLSLTLEDKKDDGGIMNCSVMEAILTSIREITETRRMNMEEHIIMRETMAEADNFLSLYDYEFKGASNESR